MQADEIKKALDEYYTVLNSDSGNVNRSSLMDKLQRRCEPAYYVVANARRILSERSYWTPEMRNKTHKLANEHGSSKYEAWRLSFTNLNEQTMAMGIFHTMFDAPIIPDFPADIS